MPNYRNGKIYRITGGGLTYIGSTCLALSQRLAQHRYNFKYYEEGKQPHTTSSFQILDKTDCVITLLEDVVCVRKEQLLARERFWIESMDCLNKIIPTRTKQEYYIDNKEHLDEYHKTYRSNNKEKISTSNKLYREAHTEEIKANYELNKNKYNDKKKEYREAHTEEIKENYELNKNKYNDKKKEYRENNKEKLLSKVECECGSITSHENRLRHKKSQFHINYVKTITPDI